MFAPAEAWCRQRSGVRAAAAEPLESPTVFGPLRRFLQTEDGETRPVALAAVILVLVASASAMGYFFWKADLGGGMPQLESPAKCWECGYTTERKPQAGEPTVLPCPRCGKEAFAPAFACPKCKTLVVLNEYRQMKPPTKCPKCGGEVRHGG